jgi:hypothetical protein
MQAVFRRSYTILRGETQPVFVVGWIFVSPRRSGFRLRIPGVRLGGRAEPRSVLAPGEVVSPYQPVSVVATGERIRPPQGSIRDFIVAQASIKDGDYVVAARLSFENLDQQIPEVRVYCKLEVGEHRDLHVQVIHEPPGGDESAFPRSVPVAVSLLVGANVSGLTMARVLIDLQPDGAEIEVSKVVLAAMRVDQLVIA